MESDDICADSLLSSRVMSVCTREIASRITLRVGVPRTGSAMVGSVAGGTSACFDCLDCCWLVELMQYLGMLLP